MTVEEALKSIKAEFATRYYEWLTDANNDEMSDREYGKKYGWRKAMQDGTFKHWKDNQQSVVWFQGHIFSGRWLPNWVKAGYDKHIIWQLSRDGFLSYEMYSNWNARAEGKTDFYYISQQTAKQIYKEFKNK